MPSSGDGNNNSGAQAQKTKDDSMQDAAQKPQQGDANAADQSAASMTRSYDAQSKGDLKTVDAAQKTASDAVSKNQVAQCPTTEQLQKQIDAMNQLQKQIDAMNDYIQKLKDALENKWIEAEVNKTTINSNAKTIAMYKNENYKLAGELAVAKDKLAQLE